MYGQLQRRTTVVMGKEVHRGMLAWGKGQHLLVQDLISPDLVPVAPHPRLTRAPSTPPEQLNPLPKRIKVKASVQHTTFLFVMRVFSGAWLLLTFLDLEQRFPFPHPPSHGGHTLHTRIRWEALWAST